MARYTYNSLESDLKVLNEKLEKLYASQPEMYRDKESLLYFVAGHRYGYSAVDLATKKDIEKYRTHRNLECGTPIKCYYAALEWIVANHI